MSAEPDAGFAIRFSRHWRTLKGYGFGLREPVIAGIVDVRLPERLDFAVLDQFMQKATGEAPPENNGGETDAERLVARALFWSGALQRHARLPIFGRVFARSVTPAGTSVEKIRVAAPAFHPRATLSALLWVERTINALLSDVTGPARGAEDDHAGREALFKALQEFKPEGVNTYRMLSAAHELGVSTRVLVGNIFCFGHGARTRWLQSSFTDRTPRLAARIAGNKFLTAYLLRLLGLPVQPHAFVASAEEAVAAARGYGYPVVVKPADRQQGKGVAANLNSDEAVIDAYKNALGFSQKILVEKHFDGIDHRMTVLDGHLAHVSARLPGGVIGDGTHSIAELVAIARAGEKRARRALERGGDPLDLDREALGLLAEKGLGPEHVPQRDEYVRLRRRGNVSAGATSTPIPLENVHPHNRRLAEQAVAAIRLDLAGVDIIFPDVTRSWMETGAHICEINGQPQIGSRATAKLLLDLIENRGRIPIVIIVGSNPQLDWEKLRGELPSAGAGLATRDGAWLDGDQVGRAMTAFDGAQVLIENKGLELLLLVISDEELHSSGLPVDRCDMLILDSADHWAANAPDRLRDLLDLVAPNAERLVAIGPGECLSTLERFEGRIETAAGPLPEMVSGIMRTLLSRPLPSDGGRPGNQVA